VIMSMGMNKKSRQIQNVKFSSIDEFFDFIPENELKIVQFLRELIRDCIPDCTEKLSYNVPTFYRHSRICFLWPASITWGNVRTDAVRLGFANGNLMRDEINFLDKGDRKQVYWKDFSDIKEIDADLLKAYIFEAVGIDDEIKKRKNKSGSG
jgi:hypothetical protein